MTWAVERSNNTPTPPMASMSARERALRFADYLMLTYDEKTSKTRQRRCERERDRRVIRDMRAEFKGGGDG